MGTFPNLKRSFHEDEVTVKPDASKDSKRETPCVSSESDWQGSPKAEKKYLHVSPATAHHAERVFSIVRNIYGENADPVDNQGVKMVMGHISVHHSSRSSSSWTLL